jgi:hypothetical protein
MLSCCLGWLRTPSIASLNGVRGADSYRCVLSGRFQPDQRLAPAQVEKLLKGNQQLQTVARQPDFVLLQVTTYHTRFPRARVIEERSLVFQNLRQPSASRFCFWNRVDV